MQKKMHINSNIKSCSCKNTKYKWYACIYIYIYTNNMQASLHTYQSRSVPRGMRHGYANWSFDSCSYSPKLTIKNTSRSFSHFLNHVTLLKHFSFYPKKIKTQDTTRNKKLVLFTFSIKKNLILTFSWTKHRCNVN